MEFYRHFNLCGLVGRLRARQLVLFWVFLTLPPPGIRGGQGREEHGPLGQPAIKVWACLRLDSPNSSATHSIFLARPR